MSTSSAAALSAPGVRLRLAEGLAASFASSGWGMEGSSREGALRLRVDFAVFVVVVVGCCVVLDVDVAAPADAEDWGCDRLFWVVRDLVLEECAAPLDVLLAALEARVGLDGVVDADADAVFAVADRESSLSSSLSSCSS